MKLSTRTRYGTRLLFELALNYGKGFLLLKYISKRQNISEKYLSKIIMQLKSAGLVKSGRGAKGGYMLSKPPSKIDMKYVVEILEGDSLFLDCINDKENCPMKVQCPTYDFWCELKKVTSEFLKSKTLEEIVSDYRRKMGETNEIYYI